MVRKEYIVAPVIVLALAWMASAEEIRGVIDKVDPSKNEMIIEARSRGARGLMMPFALNKETRIFVGRQPGELADLQPGERVRVLYEARDGNRVALGITVQGVKKKPARTPASAPAGPGENAVTGVLRRVARTDREIVVIGPGPKGEKELETTLVVPESAKITRDGKPIKLENLKEDENVVVRTEKRNGKLAAVSIQAGATAAPAAMQKPKPNLEKLRQVLKLADWILQQLSEQE